MGFYQVKVTERARKEIRLLPGNMRQRVVRTLRMLESNPRPMNSIALDLANTSIQLTTVQTLCRISMIPWRIVYFVEDDIQLVTVLTVRKRPPYQYNDLEMLLSEL